MRTGLAVLTAAALWLVIPASAAAGALYIAETSSTTSGAPASEVRLGTTDGAALSTFTAVTGSVTRVSATETRVAWNQGSRNSQTPTLFVGNRDGSGTPAAFTFASNEQVAGIAVDGTAGRVYATIANSSCQSAPCAVSTRVISVALDGTGSPTTLYDRGTGRLAVPGIVADPAGGKLYWCEFDPQATGSTVGSVVMANLDGSGTPTAIYTDEWGCNGLAVDHAANRLYWVRYVTSSTDRQSLIRVGSLDGAAAAATLYTEVATSSSSGLAYDSGAGKLYWANFPEAGVVGTGSIRTAAADGSGTPSDLYTGLTNPNDVSLIGASSPAPAPPPPVQPTAKVTIPKTLAIAPDGSVTTTCASEEKVALSSCTVTLRANASLVDGPGGGVTIRAAKRVVIGRATTTAKAGETSLKVRVKLNERGRRMLRANLALPVAVAMSITSAEKVTAEASGRTRLSMGTHTLSPDAGIFDELSTTLNAKGRAFVRRLAAILPKGPTSIRCTGYADSSGVPGDNRWLGDRRARTLCDALAARGVKSKRTTIVSKGASSPRDDNSTAQGRERNRRATVTITY